MLTQFARAVPRGGKESAGWQCCSDSKCFTPGSGLSHLYQMWLLGQSLRDYCKLNLSEQIFHQLI